MKDLEQQKLDQIIKSAGITESAESAEPARSYQVGYQDAIDNEGDDMSWLKTHWADGENSHQYRRGYADGIEAYNSGLTETNPDGTIGDDEYEERDNFYASFSMELDDLISHAMSEAERIGGQFRAPAMKHAINKIVKSSIDEAMRGKIEYLQRLPKSQGGDLPDDEFPMADPTGTLKRDIDGNIGPTK